MDRSQLLSERTIIAMLHYDMKIANLHTLLKNNMILQI